MRLHDGWAAYEENTPPGGDPLRAATIPGLPGTPAIFCSLRAKDFYAQRGGLTHCGYPLRSQFHTPLGDPLAITLEHPKIGEQVMSKAHGLCVLKVC